MYRIKELRLKAHLSQAELAKKLDISQSVLCDYENGKADPTAKVIIAMSYFFGETTDYLLGLEDETGAKVQPKYNNSFNNFSNSGKIDIR